MAKALWWLTLGWVGEAEVARLLYWATQWLRVRVIEVDGRPYLERYYVGKVFGVTAYLHRFVRGDSERWLHDHPWRLAVSVVLAGKYVEERLQWLCPTAGLVKKRVTVRRGNVIRGQDFHRIIEVQPGTWTLFMHGARVKGWGFMQQDQFRAGGVWLLDYQQPFPVERSADWATTSPRARDYRREQEWARLVNMVRSFDTEDITTPRAAA